MKKIKNLMFALVLLVCTSFGLVACLEFQKTAITTEMFVTKMEEKGYAISTESTRDLTFYDVDKTSIAAKDGCIIEFYEFASASEAGQMYERIEFDFDFDYSGSTMSANGKNYNKFECSGSAGYAMVCRVDATLMVIEIDNSIKDTAKSIVKELGY